MIGNTFCFKLFLFSVVSLIVTPFIGCEDSADGECTFYVELTGASDYDDYHLVYGLYNAGEGPEGSNEAPLALGRGSISQGMAEVTANTFDPDTWEFTGTWTGIENNSYEIWMMIDTNNNMDLEPFVDYACGDVLSFSMKADGTFMTVTGEDFSMYTEDLPAMFGVYSETAEHPVYIEPHYDFSQSVNINVESVETPRFDGDFVLEANFFISSEPQKIKITYPNNPAIMDIAASTSFVFALDDSLPTGMPDPEDQIDSFSVFFGSSGVGDYVVVDIQGDYMTASGQGPSSNWDIYSIPIAAFTSFEKTQLSDIEISFPANVATGDPLACTLYFDDIHFE